jgi:hypothetical protein
MDENLIYIMLYMHIFCCIVCFVLVKCRIIHMSLALLPLVLFIPIFGMVSLIVADRIIRNEHGEKKEYKYALYDYLNKGYNKIDMDDGDKPGAVVPLEEAILINDVQTRRKVMIGILHREPAQYLGLLKVACLNEDVEVTHYATTTISEIQRDFELAIQQKSSRVKSNPTDIVMLDDYISILSKYINSGLLDGHLLAKQRMLILQLLQKRLELNLYDKQTYFEIIENETRLQRYIRAEEAFLSLIENWPDDENAWLAGIRIYMESNNKQLKKNVLDKIKMMPIKWSSKGKEWLNFLYGEDVLKVLANTKENSDVLR